MGCIALVRCVLVLRCCLAVVVWYPYAGWGTSISLFIAQNVSDVNTSILRSLRLICWVISWVVLFCFDVCWCNVVVWLGWCGIRMRAEALKQCVWWWFESYNYACYFRLWTAVGEHKPYKYRNQILHFCGGILCIYNMTFPDYGTVQCGRWTTMLQIIIKVEKWGSGFL